MRLDLFLKKTVIIKRRTIAKEIVERGMVLLNDKVAKPSSNVLDGSKLVLHLGSHTITVIAKIETKGTKEIPSYILVSDTKE